MPDAFKGLSAKDVAKIGKVTAAPTSSDDFADAFAEDPALALAAKGIEISPEQSEAIKANLANLGGAPGTKADTEISISIKKKF